MASEVEKKLSSVEFIVETVTSRLGYATLKKYAILSFVVGRDVLVVLPTGYKKKMLLLLPTIYNQLKERMGSIAVIIYSLT